MVQVSSPRYPGLRVVDVDVKFVDGVAEVADPAVLKRLRGLSEMGVVVPESDDDGGQDEGVVPESEPVKRRPGRPRKSE